MLRQLELLPAGCQPWNDNMLDGTISKFAYCSTLAVNIYERSPESNGYKLTSINAAHEKTITSISWNKKKTNLIATSGADLKIVVWDVGKQKVFAQLRDLETDPCCIDWINTSHNQYLTYIGSTGYLEEWCISNGKVTTLKNINCITGSSQISLFRWHHTKPETVAFGYHDGSVLIFSKIKGNFKKTKIKFYDEPIDDDKVLLLSWDPLSEDYILIANKLTGIKMVDSVNGEVVTSFSLPSRAVTTATFSWIHSAPGMFLSGDYESGVLRLWSVGQESPLENFKIKPMGFNGIHVIDCVRGNAQRNFDQNDTSRSQRRKRFQSQSMTHSVPPANVVCTFRDGGVGLYDLQRRKWIFLKEQGHVETIFDCKFKANDPKILATASFDGTVKIWSTTSLSPIKTSSGNEGVIYSISWAPQNLDCIACGTRRKGVFVWDFNKERIIKRFMEHGTSCVFCVDWNRADSHKIASGSEDHTCVVRRLDGQDVHRLIHPGSVYGCHWNINNKHLLATGCDDGIVRVWSVVSVAECILKLSGHSMKVFHVRWHPLISNILCSGSDDHSIRVWDTGQTSCIAVLNGHTNRVRGLSWNSEIPYLLVSGSWDSTIRLWDVRKGNPKCLDVIDIHGADVYGLDSHSSSPFVLASSSRDSTVRLWSLAPYIKMLFAKIVVGHQFCQLLDEAEQVMKLDMGIKLSGRMSKQIADELSARPDSTAVKLRWLSEFFVGNPALENLWDLVFFSQGAKETAMSPDYKHGIVHKDHLIKYTTAKAQEMELMASKSLTGNRQQDLMLEKAADLQLKAGNLRKHCEILKQLGKWETALSLAPGVSLKYWKGLTLEYAQILEDFGDCEYLPYHIAIGGSEKCIQDLLQIGEYEDALLVAQTACEGRISVPLNDSPAKSASSKNLEPIEGSRANGIVVGDSKLEKLRDQCVDALSSSKFSGADPFQAASYHLSNTNVGAAIDTLLQGNELLLALCLGKVLKINDERIKNAAVLYARKLECEGNYYFAIEMIRSFLQCNVTEDNWTPVHSCCARFIGDDSHRVNLNEYAGLPSPSKYTSDGETYLASGALSRAMQCFLLSTQQLKALEIGLDLLKKELRRSDWTVADERISQLSMIFTVSSEILTRSDLRCQKDQLLALSAFIGCVKALSSGFLVMVTPLLEHAIAMTERVEIASVDEDFPLMSHDLKSYLESWKNYYKNSLFSETKAKRIETTDLSEVKLLQFANVKSLIRNEIVVFGSALPSHSDTIISALTNRRINGPSFCLDDGITIISLNEAIMWTRVDEFSPTGSGKRIAPI